MLPYYTKQEIIDQIRNKIESCNISEEKLREEFSITLSSLNAYAVWSVHEYRAIAHFLDLPLETLTGVHQSEDLQSVSFRAEDNTDEINHQVRKLDAIFTDLAYQIKIGGELNGR